MMPLRRIISGGQTGADQGGLAGAQAVGLATGGTAPFGYRTDEGPARTLLRDRYGLAESRSWQYPPRTRANILDADGTALFGVATSPGTALTIALCHQLDKPCLVNPTAAELRAWVDAHGIATLNIAGNRERTNPGIYGRVFDLIVAAFGPCRDYRPDHNGECLNCDDWADAHQFDDE